MGDAKLAALLGLYLGWLGWRVLVLGVAAGFVVQAVLALVLLATRRIGLRGELPFGPAMLLGAAPGRSAWSGALLPADPATGSVISHQEPGHPDRGERAAPDG